MKRQILTIEHCLYLSAFLLALAVRLIRLGSAPLSEFEAIWALQALGLSQGQAILLGTQPLYALFTGVAFTLLGSADGLARIFPALSGSLLVFAPFLWSRRFERLKVAGLLGAFGLALDPGLVAASRLAGGPAPAVTFVLLALGCALCRSAAWTGIFGGLALLTGVPLVPGVLGLAAAWAAAKWLESRHWLAPLTPAGTQPEDSHALPAFLRRTALFGGVTLLLAGTLFLFVPQGLAAVADTFTAYLRGWARPSGELVFRMAFALVVYQPLALIFGVVGAVRGWIRPEPVIQRLALWVFFSLVLALAYPARQTVDLAWSLVPLWVLAGWELQHHLPSAKEKPETGWQAWAYGLGVIVLLVVGWLGLIAGKALLAVLALGMVIAVAFIVAMWSTRVMRYGLVWGVCVALVVGMFAATSGVAWVHPNSAQELWSISPVTGEAKLLLDTLENLSQWKTGERQAIDITVVSNSSVLHWLLRNFPNAQFSPEFTGADATLDTPPAVVITYQSTSTPGMPVLYRGQDFILSIAPGWRQVLPNDWIDWVAYRQAPLLEDQVILWARTDLFPGGVLEKSALPLP
jgi:hypothetical protein